MTGSAPTTCGVSWVTGAVLVHAQRVVLGQITDHRDRGDVHRAELAIGAAEDERGGLVRLGDNVCGEDHAHAVGASADFLDSAFPGPQRERHPACGGQPKFRRPARTTTQASAVMLRWVAVRSVVLPG